MLRGRNLFILIFLFVFVRMHSDSSNQIFNIKVSGTVVNPIYDSIRIADNDITLDSKGSFNQVIHVGYEGYHKLIHANEADIFLSKGMKLIINLDAKNFYQSLKFKGKGAEKNNFLNGEAGKFRKINYGQLLTLDTEAFLIEGTQIEDDFHRRLDFFIKKHPGCDSKFKKFQRAAITYRFADFFLFHSKVKELIAQLDQLECAHHLKKYLGKLNFNDETLLKSKVYLEFLDTYIKVRIEGDFRKDIGLKNADHFLLKGKLRFIKRFFTNQNVKNYLLYSTMGYFIDNYGITGMDDVIDAFFDNCENQGYKDKIKRLVESTRKKNKGVTTKIFKKGSDYALHAYIFKPQKIKKADKRPCIVFFHGGGWFLGDASWAFEYCRHFQKKGMVAISAQYRLTGRHNISALDCMADAKSAIRWIRDNSAELGIHPDKIVAAGWSAGGHIAASAAMIPKFDEEGEDLSVSSKPNALWLLFPGLNVAKDNWFIEQLKGKADAEECSPSNYIKKDLPPCIIFQGTKDREVPYWTIEKFDKEMKEKGNMCMLHAFKDRPHLFFRNKEDSKRIIELSDEFFESLGYYPK